MRSLGGGGAAPSSGRGALLRETNRLTSDVLEQHARLRAAAARLAEEAAQRAELQERLAAAEAEHAAAERQRADESANDGELVGLQRAVGAATLRRQELIKATKVARAERDRARDESQAAYYARLGAEYESAAVARTGGAAEAAGAAGPAGAASGGAVAWTPEATRLLAEADALWRRASNQGVITRDLVEAALLLADLQLEEDVAEVDGAGGGGGGGGGGGEGSSSRSLASGTASAYSFTGAGVALADTRKSLAGVQEALDACGALRERARGAGGAGEEALAAVSACIVLVRQNLAMQRNLLLEVERALGGGVEDGNGGGGGGGGGADV